jgi:hypothetical protein
MTTCRLVAIGSQFFCFDWNRGKAPRWQAVSKMENAACRRSKEGRFGTRYVAAPKTEQSVSACQKPKHRKNLAMSVLDWRAAKNKTVKIDSNSGTMEEHSTSNSTCVASRLKAALMLSIR